MTLQDAHFAYAKGCPVFRNSRYHSKGRITGIDSDLPHFQIKFTPDATGLPIRCDIEELELVEETGISTSSI
jgi:hypothetical protein